MLHPSGSCFATPLITLAKTHPTAIDAAQDVEQLGSLAMDMDCVCRSFFLDAPRSDEKTRELNKDDYFSPRSYPEDHPQPFDGQKSEAKIKQD